MDQNKFTYQWNSIFQIREKNSYRIRIKVRWCIESSLQKIFWKFIQHTHLQTPSHFRTLPHTPMHTRAYLTHPPNHTHIHVCTFACTCARPCTPLHTQAHLSTPEHTRAHPSTPAHTHTHQHTPMHIPHIPADALNLINHMKLHVNTVIWKKGDRYMIDRKRKEQESAEAISGLKK